jgi:hypothetical protein
LVNNVPEEGRARFFNTLAPAYKITRRHNSEGHSLNFKLRENLTAHLNSKHLKTEYPTKFSERRNIDLPTLLYGSEICTINVTKIVFEQHKLSICCEQQGTRFVSTKEMMKF